MNSWFFSFCASFPKCRNINSLEYLLKLYWYFAVFCFSCSNWLFIMLWIKWEYCVPFFSLHLLQKKPHTLLMKPKGWGLQKRHWLIVTKVFNKAAIVPTLSLRNVLLLGWILYAQTFCNVSDHCWYGLYHNTVVRKTSFSCSRVEVKVYPWNLLFLPSLWPPPNYFLRLRHVWLQSVFCPKVMPLLSIWRRAAHAIFAAVWGWQNGEQM